MRWKSFLAFTISIHTSPEGSDAALLEALKARVEFQSTLPLREVTQAKATSEQIKRQFQSTLPLREVTTANQIREPLCHDFNPHFP